VTAAGALLAAAVPRLAAVSDSALLDAEVLLAFATGRTRSSLLAFPERSVTLAEAERFEALVARRARGEPVAYLRGVKEFFSLEFRVTPDVLIPRADTELLVAAALEHLEPLAAPAVLDAGTGSGAIAVAIKHVRPDAVVTAVDVSHAALAMARANAASHRLDVRCVESSWFDALGGERFDAIVCNPPYIRAGDPALDALRFEPRHALAAGEDGLDAFRAVLARAAEHLMPRGVLLFEHGYDQRAALAALARVYAFRVVEAREDLAGHARVLALRVDAPRSISDLVQ
jgi:release factor glutamine methyltransferase